MNKIRDLHSAITVENGRTTADNHWAIPRLMVRLLTYQVAVVLVIMTVSARTGQHLIHRLSRLVTIAVYLMRLVLTALLFRNSLTAVTANGVTDYGL